MSVELKTFDDVKELVDVLSVTWKMLFESGKCSFDHGYILFSDKATNIRCNIEIWAFAGEEIDMEISNETRHYYPTTGKYHRSGYSMNLKFANIQDLLNNFGLKLAQFLDSPDFYKDVVIALEKR